MNSFKKIANDAKKRLVNGYWEDVYRNRDEDILVATQNGVPSDFVVGAYRQKVNASISKDDTIVDELFYQKVYDIVTRELNGEIVTNPLSILSDGLTSREHDIKSVLQISVAYIETRRRIEREIKIKSLKQLLD